MGCLLLGACGDDGSPDGGAEGAASAGGAAEGAASAGGAAEGAASTGGGGSQGGGGDGGGGGTAPLVCGEASGDYGVCATELGWAFDGDDCAARTGCDCAPDCDVFHASLDDCIAACDAYCDDAAFVGGGIASDGWGEGDFCDSVTACVPSEAMSTAQGLFADITCEGGAGCPNFCTLYDGGTITAEQLDALCSATLIEGLGDVTCLVLGP